MGVGGDPHPPFAIIERDGSDPVVLAVSGELDLAVAEEVERAIAAAANGGRKVCVDLAACTFIDSTGMKIFVQAARELRSKGGELSVTNIEGDVARLFEITGLLLDGSALVYRPSV
jgi:anti-sigma B factor antagonist